MAKILVVDDELQMLELVKARLESHGYQVVTAADGAEGLRQAESEIPDLILLDIIMPGLDGYSVLQKLKSAENTKDIPVIIFTGVSESVSGSDKPSLGLMLGAVDHIVKPFDSANLLKTIKKHIKQDS